MKTIYFWLIAIIITLSAAVYQKTTGPTYPKHVKLNYSGKIFKFKLPRSHSISSDCPVIININNKIIKGQVEFKKFPSNDKWTIQDLIRKDNNLTAELPSQPAAGKVMYRIILSDNNKELLRTEPIVVRYKGDVPAGILIPHIFFMFFSMLLSTLAGLLVIGKKPKYKFYGGLTVLFLLIGGMILGPVVQKYAFNEFWTGVPFGWDLTDNKTLIAFVFWLIAYFGNIKKERPYLIIIAAVVLLLIFSIPHSMFGSQLDYASGVVGQG